MPHALIQLLDDLGAVCADRLEEYHPRVRDRDDIAVLRCPVSDVIVLSSIDHVEASYYEQREALAEGTYAVHGEKVDTPRLEDNVRRADDFGGYIRGKRWLDVGCGLGGMLDEMASEAGWAGGLEPNRERAAIVAGKGHEVVGSIDEIDGGSLDVVTLFHVMEHLTEPVEVMAGLRRALKPGGVALVEVPHARDALFALYDCEPFKNFTFWSEHLVLHTRQSLALVLAAAGFESVEISGYQRYPLANHLHWLAKQRPGGHEAWRFLASPGLQSEYEATLARLDRTDTLIAVARVPLA